MEYAKIGSLSSTVTPPLVGLIACIAQAANAVTLGNTALGVISFATLLFTASLAISRIAFGNRNLSLDDWLLCMMSFLTLVCIVIAPFAIFSNFTSIHFAALQVAIGIGVFFSSLKYKALRTWHFSEKNWTFKWKEVIFLMLVASALIADLVILAGSRSDAYSWIWQKIPASHFSLLFFATLAVVTFVVFSKMSNSTKLAVIIAHSILVESYIAITIATLPGSDNWYMLGEIKGAISGTTSYDALSSATINIGNIALPSVLILGWARGFANSLLIFFSHSLEMDPCVILPWVAPIFFSVFAKTVVYRMGRILSNDDRYPLIVSLALTFGVFILFFEASTTKLSLGLTFLILGMYLWVNYAAKNTSRNLALASAFLAVNVMNYSLFFLALLIFAILSVSVIKIRSYQQRQSMPYHKKWSVVIALTLGALLLVPFIDTLEQTKLNWSKLSPAYIGTDMWDFLVNKSGFFLPLDSLGSKQVFPASNILVNNSGWLISSIFLWAMTVIGLLNWRKFNNNMFTIFVWFALIIHLSWFIVQYASEGAKPVGGYLFILTDLSKIPFIGMGLTWTFNFVRYRTATISLNYEEERSISVKSVQPYKVPRILMITLPLVSILVVSIVVVSLQTVETRFTNLTTQDVEAAKFIAKTPGKYVVITDLFAAGPVYTFSNGVVNGGGFPVEYIPNVKIDVRTNQYFDELKTSDDVHKTIEKARKESGACTIYVLVPSYISLNDSGLARLVDNLGPYKSFGSNTKLFTYNACS
jgi:hypothetical protein